jgi:hypothetical protein
MVFADWGLESDEAVFPDAMDRRWESVDSDDPAMVAAAKAARKHGYEPAHEAPLWCFVPAMWPAPARCWVRDTRVRHSTVSGERGPSGRVPWCTALYAEIESDINRLLAECGIPPRPAGRLWLLRPPPGFDSVGMALDQISAAAEVNGEDIMVSARFAAHAKREIRRLFTPVSGS